MNNSPLHMALSLLPSAGNDMNLLKNIATHISRVVVTHMSFFQFSLSDATTWHIQHKFYNQTLMHATKKSEVVSARVSNIII